MPHLYLELPAQAAPVRADRALAALQACMAASGLFSPDDIKGRVLMHPLSCQGHPAGPARYLHVRVMLMAGRSPVQRQQLAQALLDTLEQAVAPGLGADWQLSVELAEIAPENYAKRVT